MTDETTPNDTSKTSEPGSAAEAPNEGAAREATGEPAPDSTNADEAAAAEAFAQIAELAKKAEERDRLFEQLQRLNAEFQNFRARTTKEKADERRYAVRDVMRNLLPALDNLERALSVDAAADPASLIEGVRMTADQFRSGLEASGMKRIVAEGAMLDPKCMDAVFKVESAEQPPNSVVAVFEHGYMLNELVVRPAKVSVAVSPTAPPTAS